MAPTTYFIASNISKYIALIVLKSHNHSQVCMFIYFHFSNFKISLFLHQNIVNKMVRKNDEFAMKLNNNVDISLQTLKRHGIKYFLWLNTWITLVVMILWCGQLWYQVQGYKKTQFSKLILERLHLG